MSLYLNSVYGNPRTEAWFRERYAASGKKLDMGKSCVRFRRIDDLPLDVIGETIARADLDTFLAFYEADWLEEYRSLPVDNVTRPTAEPGDWEEPDLLAPLDRRRDTSPRWLERAAPSATAAPPSPEMPPA